MSQPTAERNVPVRSLCYHSSQESAHPRDLRTRAWLLVLSLALMLVPSLRAQTTSAQPYILETIDAPGFNPSFSFVQRVQGLNNAGQVVGFYGQIFHEHGFRFEGGRFTTINFPGADETFLQGINDSGQIVGNKFIDFGSLTDVNTGFLLSGGSFTALHSPGVLRGAAFAYGINNAGAIVGSYQDIFANFHGFLMVGSNFTTIDFPGAIQTFPAGINDSGQIVGNYLDTAFRYHGFLFSGGQYSTIDYPRSFIYLTGINNAGQIVGVAQLGNFILAGGQFSTIHLPGVRDTDFFVSAINDSGWLAGNYQMNFVSHGFLAKPGQKFRVVARSMAPGAGAPHREAADIPQAGDPTDALNFALGENFMMSVVQVNGDGTDGSDVSSTAAPLQTTDQQISTIAQGNENNLSEFVSPTRLFPNQVLIQFTDTPRSFMPVHSGTATVSLTFNPTGASSPRTIRVPIKISVPTIVSGRTCSATNPPPLTVRLGINQNKFDDCILQFADLRGIPPQILKAQISHETAGTFNPDVYRYEPLSVDFRSISAGQDLRTAPRYSPYALATFPDFVIPLGLSQGGALAHDPNDLHRREVFKVFTSTTGNPVTNVVILPSQGVDYNSLPTRRILASDPPVSMENILLANDSTQHWIYPCTGTAVCKMAPSFINWWRLRSTGFGIPSRQAGLFTGQPVIAGSYGLLQVLYTTAVDLMDYTDNVGVGLAPNNLLTPQTALDYGTEYLAGQFETRFTTGPSVSSKDDLQAKFGRALQSYNGNPDPRAYTKPILANSNQYFPLQSR